jgi:SAM-dependent methyltransferase
MTADLPEHVARNRIEWDNWAAGYARVAPGAWAQEAITWGELHVPEADVRALPDSVEGMDVIELGCGTAYFSAWLARRGANPVGIDNSPNQLATAREMQDRFDLHFPLHLGNAEHLPFADASFDFAISEYGASIWCDPYAWIPEAARVLRPGGQLVFLVNGLLAMLCTSPDDTADIILTNCLRRPYFGVHRFEWPDDDGVAFHIGYGAWIRLLRANGFEVENLIELQPPEGSTKTPATVPIEWARQWPAEEIWVARKR